MKKRYLLLFIFAFSLNVFGNCRISGIEGTIAISKAGLVDSISKDTALTLDSGIIISTLDTSTATLSTSPRSTLILKSGTSIELIDSNHIVLLLGTGFFNIKTDSANPFFVRAAETELSVKGTGFAVKMEKEASSFAVITGSVLLKDENGKEVSVAAGFKCKKEKGKPFSELKAMTEKELRVLKEMIPSLPGSETTSPAENDSLKTDSLETKQASDSLAKTDSAAMDSAGADSSLAKDSTAADTTQTAEADSAATDSAKIAKEKDGAEEQAGIQPPDEQEKDKKKDEKEGGIAWEVGFGSVTVDGKQWQRINISPDIPIGKFGVCLDLELFVDDSGKFSDKGWAFETPDKAQKSMLRKIRYIRFGKPKEKVYLKLGALDNVTIGYGLIMSNFNNTFDYPAYKKMGLEFELNDLTPLGLGLQAVIHDLLDIKNEATIAGGRIYVTPMKMMKVPLLSKLQIGVSAVGDENQYRGRKDDDGDRVPNLIDDYPSDPERMIKPDPIEPDPFGTDSALLADADASIAKAAEEENFLTDDFDRKDRFVIWGIDAGMPVLQTKALGVTVYGQFASNYDYQESDNIKSDNFSTEGWGIAAPGVMLNAGPISGQLEFRHLENRFEASFFNSSYEQDRLTFTDTAFTSGIYDIRTVKAIPKEAKLDSISVNGIFGAASAGIGPVAILSGSYQHLVAKDADPVITMTASASTGALVAQKVPKLESVTLYWGKDRIGRVSIIDTVGNERKDKFFENTIYTIYGYKIGFELAESVVLYWDKRTNFIYNKTGDLVPEVRMNIQTAIKF